MGIFKACVTSKEMNMLTESNSSTKNDCYYVIRDILWGKGDISCRQRGVDEDYIIIAYKDIM